MLKGEGKGKGKGKCPPPPAPVTGKGEGKGMKSCLTAKSRRPGYQHATQLALDGTIVRGSTMSGQEEFSCAGLFQESADGKITARHLKGQLEVILGADVATIRVVLLREFEPLVDDDVVTESDVNSILVKWSTGWPKVQGFMLPAGESDTCLEDHEEGRRRSEVAAERERRMIAFVTAGPGNGGRQPMSYEEGRRTVEFAVEAAAERERRISSFVTPGPGICIGSRSRMPNEIPNAAWFCGVTSSVDTQRSEIPNAAWFCCCFTRENLA